jgi:hypothetical protein
MQRRYQINNEEKILTSISTSLSPSPCWIISLLFLAHRRFEVIEKLVSSEMKARIKEIFVIVVAVTLDHETHSKLRENY